MFSGGQEATDGGTRHVRTVSTRADEAPPSGPEQQTHRFRQHTRFTPSKIRPSRVRGRWTRLAKPAEPPPERERSVTESVPLLEATDLAAPVTTPRWVRRYQISLVAIDLCAAAIAVAIAAVLRFGWPVTGTQPARYVAFGLALPLVWIVVVAANRAYEGRFVGVGAAEFQRIFRAFLHVTALVAFGSFATSADLSRGFIGLALPMALGLDLLGRYGARKFLHRQRTAGRSMRSVLAVGDPDGVAQFISLLDWDTYAGMRVVGACLPGEIDDAVASKFDAIGMPLVDNLDSLLEAAQFVGADTVAVVSSAIVGPERLRWISWQLEGTDLQLVVSPGLIEVAGPRLHIQPVAGLPLLYVEKPQFAGFRRLLKSALDRTVAFVAVVLLSPLLLMIALGVRLSSRGPALFIQTRVGRDGRTFRMVKFRSMYVDAEDRLAGLRDQNLNLDGLLFKLRDDPRVTRIGKILRKFSFDELPQLINIIAGSMSLVGPRPPLPSEVARYGDDVRRRLLVKPGLTGLWQVSGRSDLTWEESVRLDLRYVENWSPALDLMILWKTAFAVLGRSGAY
jgi:exopolysaccharide biosynthesis polyprenyl glycosylphosphotransferase